MVTVYDATFARLCALSAVDLLLVGDSLGMVIQGYSDTLRVTVEQVAYHVSSVRRGAPDSFIIADMPFGSYQASDSDGIKSAIQFIAAGADMIKLEGAGSWIPLIEKLVAAGVPVMGHLGLTPQSVKQLGGFRVQGRNEQAAQKIRDDALLLQKSGCDALVLESIPTSLAESITNSLSIPTIGIGAGASTDGQVLVLQDLLGMNHSFKPKFVKHFAQLETSIVKALNEFSSEVNLGTFPSDDHCYSE